MILSHKNQIGLVSFTFSLFLLARFARQILVTKVDLVFKILVCAPGSAHGCYQCLAYYSKHYSIGDANLKLVINTYNVYDFFMY